MTENSEKSLFSSIFWTINMTGETMLLADKMGQKSQENSDKSLFS